MTELILGGAGSGKTFTVNNKIVSDLSCGASVILLVPEQMAIYSEGRICAEAQRRGVPQTELEILNFKRLCNRIFREYGGIAYNAVNGGAKALLMWEALFSVAPQLMQYGSEVEDAGNFIPMLLSAIKELKSYKITPKMLEEASIASKKKNTKLSEKLSDLALIYSAFSLCLERGFDDPSDDLTRAGELLEVNKFFKGKRVYIDSFVGFTPQELSMLFQIMKQAEYTCVALPYICSEGESNEKNSVLNTDTYKAIRSIASRVSENTVITKLYDAPRFASPELRFLSRSLQYLDSKEIYEKETRNIRTVRAENIYDEVEFTALDIIKKIREGARYKDIAVIAGNTEAYSGILDSVFSRYGIHCHFSERIELSEKPLFKLILSALNIRNGGWRTSDVISFLKTGLTPVTPSECDEIEAYASAWNIIGSTWYGENDWKMNPEGYSGKYTERSEELLSRLNEIRKRFTYPLRKFFEILDGRRSVSEICMALYTLLTELTVPDIMSKNGSDEDVRVWNCMCDSLDTLSEVSGERTADAKLFSGLLSLVIKQTSFGSLPKLSDEIVFGSANLIRANDIKHAYLIGVCEGVFPSPVAENGLFSDGEKELLSEEYGVTLSPTCHEQAMRELYNFYASASIPSETLTVSCYLGSASGAGRASIRPSLSFLRIEALFPKCERIITSEMSFDSRIQNKISASELVSMMPKSKERTALLSIFESDSSLSEIFCADREPLSSDVERLTPEASKLLFGKDMALTQSRLEAYVMCGFKYACTYQLKLKERQSSQFNLADIGTLTHYILERFFAAVASDGMNISELGDDFIERIVSEILNDYLRSVFGEDKNGALTARAFQLFLRLKRAVKCVINNIIEELSQSDFTPAFFELEINGSGADGTVQPLKIPLYGGSNVYIYGKVDRVDICKRGEDVYVRVVDYKTGSKDFSLTDVAAGLNLQMLLYLFSIWHDSGGQFRKAVGCEGKIIPAGVLYSPARPKATASQISYNSTPEEIYKAVSRNLMRKGLLIDDEEILRKMEKKLEGVFIPITSEKDRVSVKSGMTLSSLEQLGQLQSQLAATVAELAEEMRAGNFSAVPKLDSKGKPQACRYCPHKAVCRNEMALSCEAYDI